jgi:hypothetical protein
MTSHDWVVPCLVSALAVWTFVMSPKTTAGWLISIMDAAFRLAASRRPQEAQPIVSHRKTCAAHRQDDTATWTQEAPPTGNEKIE